MNNKTTATASLGGLTILLLLTPGAASHPGNGGAFSPGYRLEGENYSSAPPGCCTCDPDTLGEHVAVYSDPIASGGQYVLLPNDTCWIKFGSLFFASPGYFSEFRIVGVQGLDGPTSVRFTVEIDGVDRYQRDFTIGPAEGGLVLSLNPLGTNLQGLGLTTAVSPGGHQVVFKFKMPAGIGNADLLLDYVDYKPYCRPVFSDGLCSTASDGTWSQVQQLAQAAGPTVLKAVHDGCRIVFGELICGPVPA